MFDKLRKPPELTVGFAIAVIALGAKMAKADGHVTRNEVTAFREVFAIPQADEKSAARVFNLAREDVAGFEDYARKIATMFEADSAVLNDLMDGLFHIAVADGEYHPAEDAFLVRVAEIFGMSKRDFAATRARNVPNANPDPYTVLGVDPAMTLAQIRKVWRRLVIETHPDRMMARGVPKEAVQLAQTRLIAINRAWEEIEAHHGD